MSQNSTSNPKESGRFAQVFEDDNGNPSSMRVMSFISLITACLLAGYIVYSNGSQNDLVLLFLAGAFAPKLFQKFAEKWTPK